jgi:hypothetical protein
MFTMMRRRRRKEVEENEERTRLPLLKVLEGYEIYTSSDENRMRRFGRSWMEVFKEQQPSDVSMYALPSETPE